ncbi:MAG: magnesium/cobalt transporter CorA [Verrucomicrobia bacterium]|nr:magnesium/cobalt transporter CorA [Verrucomicrobiota bacterium]
MERLYYQRPGTAPATLELPPAHAGRSPVMRLMEYDAQVLHDRIIEGVHDLPEDSESRQVRWLNVGGLGDVELLRSLGQHFHIHPLALEDTLDPSQRPKLDEYEGQLFIVLKMVYEGGPGEIVFEQVSFVLGRNWLITFQEDAERDVFEPIRTRLREAAGNLRFMRVDYLAYALIDAIVDHYFPIMESVGEAVDDLEQALLGGPNPEALQRIHAIRRTLLQLRRAIWPTRDVIGRLYRDETGHISDRTKPFLRDCYDHAVTLIDLLENYRDATGNLTELYLSSLSMRTNEIVRVLTVVSSIFIPLTFIAGVYGMNFDTSKGRFNMPELHWRYGYPAALLLMALIAGSMLYYFRRKKWL